MEISERDLQQRTKQVGRRIQQLRKTTGLTQVELEERAQVYDVGAIERGESANPTILTYMRLAAALEVDLSDLFIAPKQRKISKDQQIRQEITGLLLNAKAAKLKKAKEMLKLFLST